MTQPVWNVMLATCPSRTSLARIANKWTAMIVIALSDGPLRFGEVRTAVGGISGKVLADTLRELERDGIVERPDAAPVGKALPTRLTARGLRSLEAASAAVRSVERRMLSGMSDVEQETALHALRSMAHALRG